MRDDLPPKPPHKISIFPYTSVNSDSLGTPSSANRRPTNHVPFTARALGVTHLAQPRNADLRARRAPTHQMPQSSTIACTACVSTGAAPSGEEGESVVKGYGIGTGRVPCGVGCGRCGRAGRVLDGELDNTERDVER